MLENKPMCESIDSTTAATTTFPGDENTTNITTTTTTTTNNNTTANITDATTSSDKTPSDPTGCDPGIVFNNTIRHLLTPGVMEEVLQEIVNHLSVKKAELSVVRRAKESAPDPRTSSTGMGYFSLSFIGGFLSLMVIFDCRKLFLDICVAVRHVRSFFT